MPIKSFIGGNPNLLSNRLRFRPNITITNAERNFKLPVQALFCVPEIYLLLFGMPSKILHASNLPHAVSAFAKWSCSRCADIVMNWNVTANKVSGNAILNMRFALWAIRLTTVDTAFRGFLRNVSNLMLRLL